MSKERDFDETVSLGQNSSDEPSKQQEDNFSSVSFDRSRLKQLAQARQVLSHDPERSKRWNVKQECALWNKLSRPNTATLPTLQKLQPESIQVSEPRPEQNSTPGSEPSSSLPGGSHQETERRKSSHVDLTGGTSAKQVAAGTDILLTEQLSVSSLPTPASPNMADSIGTKSLPSKHKKERSKNSDVDSSTTLMTARTEDDSRAEDTLSSSSSGKVIRSPDRADCLRFDKAAKRSSQSKIFQTIQPHSLDDDLSKQSVDSRGDTSVSLSSLRRLKNVESPSLENTVISPANSKPTLAQHEPHATSLRKTANKMALLGLREIAMRHSTLESDSLSSFARNSESTQDLIHQQEDQDSVPSQALSLSEQEDDGSYLLYLGSLVKGTFTFDEEEEETNDQESTTSSLTSLDHHAHDVKHVTVIHRSQVSERKQDSVFALLFLMLLIPWASRHVVETHFYLAPVIEHVQQNRIFIAARHEAVERCGVLVNSVSRSFNNWADESEFGGNVRDSLRLTRYTLRTVADLEVRILSSLYPSTGQLVSVREESRTCPASFVDDSDISRQSIITVLSHEANDDEAAHILATKSEQKPLASSDFTRADLLSSTDDNVRAASGNKEALQSESVIEIDDPVSMQQPSSNEEALRNEFVIEINDPVSMQQPSGNEEASQSESVIEINDPVFTQQPHTSASEPPHRQDDIEGQRESPLIHIQDRMSRLVEEALHSESAVQFSDIATTQLPDALDREPLNPSENLWEGDAASETLYAVHSTRSPSSQADREINVPTKFESFVQSALLAKPDDSRSRQLWPSPAIEGWPLVPTSTKFENEATNPPNTNFAPIVQSAGTSVVTSTESNPQRRVTEADDERSCLDPACTKINTYERVGSSAAVADELSKASYAPETVKTNQKSSKELLAGTDTSIAGTTSSDRHRKRGTEAGRSALSSWGLEDDEPAATVPYGARESVSSDSVDPVDSLDSDNAFNLFRENDEGSLRLVVSREGAAEEDDTNNMFSLDWLETELEREGVRSTEHPEEGVKALSCTSSVLYKGSRTSLSLVATAESPDVTLKHYGLRAIQPSVFQDVRLSVGGEMAKSLGVTDGKTSPFAHDRSSLSCSLRAPCTFSRFSNLRSVRELCPVRTASPYSLLRRSESSCVAVVSGDAVHEIDAQDQPLMDLVSEWWNAIQKNRRSQLSRRKRPVFPAGKNKSERKQNSRQNWFAKARDLLTKSKKHTR